MEVTIDLPTPPLPLTTPITFRMLLISWGFSIKLVGAPPLREGQFSPQELQSWVQFSISLNLISPFDDYPFAEFFTDSLIIFL